jgi:acetyl esterase/lipase
MYRLIALLLSVLLILTACSTPAPNNQETNTPTTNETEGPTVPEIVIHPDRVNCTVPTENVEGNYVYKCIGNRKLEIIYYPPTKQVYEKAPVLLLICGGGFVECTVGWPIEWHAPEVKKLREAGFAVASVDYRVRDEGVNILQVYSDIADSMRYLSYYSDVFNIDPNKIVTSGHSAGGAAALAMAYIDNRTFDEEKYWPEADYKVVGAFAMSHSGTLEKTDYGTYDGYASLGIKTNISLYVNDEIRHLASPINHLDANDPPCKILMGDMDEVVSPISTQKFKDACDAAGVSCELVWLKNAGHVYDSMNGEQVLPRFSVQKMKLVDFAISCVTPK